MVAENEIGVRRNDDFGTGAVVAEIIEDVRLIEKIPVYVNSAIVDFDVVPSNADNTLDVTLARIVGIAKDDDIATLYRLPVVDKLINEDTFLIVEARHHAGAFDFDWLINEHDDKNGDSEGDDDVAHPRDQVSLLCRWWGFAHRVFQG